MELCYGSPGSAEQFGLLHTFPHTTSLTCLMAFTFFSGDAQSLISSHYSWHNILSFPSPVPKVIFSHSFAQSHPSSFLHIQQSQGHSCNHRTAVWLLYNLLDCLCLSDTGLFSNHQTQQGCFYLRAFTLAFWSPRWCLSLLLHLLQMPLSASLPEHSTSMSFSSELFSPFCFIFLHIAEHLQQAV